MSLTGVWMNELSSDPHCGNGSNGLLVENGKAVWDSGENDSQAAVRTSTAADRSCPESHMQQGGYLGRHHGASADSIPFEQAEHFYWVK
jgi:hypothetical protein